jgi:hypothetical protein
MRRLALVLCLAIVGCSRSGGSQASPDTSTVAPGGALTLTKDTVVVKWTGKWDGGYTVISVTNNGPDTLKHAQLFFYTYDKSGKQLGVESHEFWDFDVPKGGTKEVTRGMDKTRAPAGTEVIEVTCAAAGFANGAKGADLGLAPDKRPMGGGAASPGANAPAAATAAPAAAADYADLTGGWISDWGVVKIDGNVGSYSDTYGTGPGRLEFTKTGDHAYSCVWGESKKRHGTMTVTLSSDGRKLTGRWSPDADVTIGGRGGGPINWVKKH